MSPKNPSIHANIGMPSRDTDRAATEAEQNREYASEEKALQYAAALASRNAELMRRLA